VAGDGLYWLGMGALITAIPMLVVGFVARYVFKLNYLSLCGLLAGSMTDPPALGFANQIASSDAPSITYASVYATGDVYAHPDRAGHRAAAALTWLRHFTAAKTGPSG
jgi:uncharacterized transporter YbjL